ncbi:MAG TPA: VWA domain-containing protein [Candidatus Binataceae bacterium]|nr:VWA domain-containing protein [Candidatus Binataceae bacterium]
MTSLREQLGKFIAELRAAGIRVSVAESIDAMNAVAAAGLERIPMREALAAALIKDEADRSAFDEVFGRFFAAPPSRGGRRQHPDSRGMQESSASGQGRPGENPPLEQRREETKQKKQQGELRRSEKKPSESTRERSSDEQMKGAASREPFDAQAESRVPRGSWERKAAEEQGIEGERMARMREIERRPFTAYTDLEFDQARDALKPLERRFRIRVGRRLRLARRGRVDFRRTIRAGIQRGGLLAELRFRSRRPRHVDLLILADISGSVRYAAELMLELVAGASNCFRRVRSFVYIDHLAEAEFEQGHLVTTPALDMYARSDFGRVLAELWKRGAELLNRQTLVVILGDARNNRRPARADLLREIARSCRGVAWLNPEDQARWGTGDSAINQYRAVVTALYPSGNLRELEKALVAAC